MIDTSKVKNSWFGDVFGSKEAKDFIEPLAFDGEIPSANQIPPVPKDGWTAKTLARALLSFPPDAKVRIFCAFDTEGPNTWEALQLSMKDGEVRLEP